MNTEQLIERLMQEVQPVRPPHAPWMRAVGWLIGASLYLGSATVLMMSPDALAGDADGLFVFQQIAALVTGIAAAVAAFASVIPGYPRRVLHVTAAAASVWLVSLLAGALQEPARTAIAVVA